MASRAAIQSRRTAVSAWINSAITAFRQSFFADRPQLLLFQSEIFQPCFEQTLRSPLPMISHHLPLVSIRSSPAPILDLSRPQLQEFLPKLLRPEKPSSPQRGVNRQFRLALPWRIDRPGLDRMPPIHPPLQHLQKLPAPSPGIRATAHRHPHLRSKPLRTRLRQRKAALQAAPAIAFPSISFPHQSRSHRIQMKVIQQGPETVARLHHDGFVTPAKYMPPQSVPHIDPPHVRILQPRHPTRQIALRSFQKQMIVVCHQDIGMNHKPGALARFPRCSHPCAAVLVTPHNRFTTVSPRHHVVNSPSIFHSRFSWHRGGSSENAMNVNRQGLTPHPLTSYADWPSMENQMKRL